MDFAEKNMNKIILRGIDKEIFGKVCSLLNTGKVSITLEDVIPMYITCRYLMVKDIYLQDLMEFIKMNIEHLDPYNLIELFSVINDCLLYNVAGFFAPNAETLSNLPLFQEFPLQAMLGIITHSQIKIDNEDSICWMVAKWLVKCQERKKYVAAILQKIAPTKFKKDFRLTISDNEWNLQGIADLFWFHIFQWQRPTQRPLRCEFFKPGEPLYVSNENGTLILTHFEGSQWSTLTAPRSPLPPSTLVSAGVRKQADLFIGVLECDSSFQLQTNVLHYNFRSKKIIKIANPVPGEMKGLYYFNDKLYWNTRDIVQQYCPEHDLWLNPLNIGLSDYQFSTTDAECLVVCGHYDWSGHNSIHFYDPRIPEWIYFADVPHEYYGTCGTFIGDDLFMVGLNYNPKNWRVLKLDVRNCQWEIIINHWARNSATPTSIKRCRDSFVVMDHHQNTYTAPITGGHLTFYDHYRYILKPVYSVD